MMMRSWIGTTKDYKSEAKAAHEHFVDGWRKAIRFAEEAQNDGKWPVHVDGKFTLNQGIL